MAKGGLRTLLLGALLSGAFAIAMQMLPVAYAQYAIPLLWGSILVAAISGGMLLWWRQDSPAEAPSVANDTYNNSGYNFGHIGPINNFGKQPFQLTPAIINQIVAAIPVGSDVTVTAVGTQSAFPMRDAIAAALSANGCKVELDSAMQIMPPPERPITVTENFGKPLVIVAPNA